MLDRRAMLGKFESAVLALVLLLPLMPISSLLDAISCNYRGDTLIRHWIHLFVQALDPVRASLVCAGTGPGSGFTGLCGHWTRFGLHWFVQALGTQISDWHCCCSWKSLDGSVRRLLPPKKKQNMQKLEYVQKAGSPWVATIGSPRYADWRRGGGIRQKLEPQPRSSRIKGKFQNPNLTNRLFVVIAEVNM